MRKNWARTAFSPLLRRFAAAHAVEATSMSYSVGLYRGFTRKGGTTFSALPATQSSDYVSKPEGILSQDEAEHVSWQLRRTPVICQGAVGPYVWRQEEV
jgi:hypothetical protein